MRDALKFMGTPCKHGHEGLRYERTGSCVHCALLYALKQSQARRALKTASIVPCGTSAS